MNLFGFLRQFGPFLSLLGCLFYGSYASADPNPQCLMYVQSGFSKVGVSELTRLGYRIVESPNLRFHNLSMRLHMEKGAWLFERNSKNDRIYFEFADGFGNAPILSYTLGLGKLISCKDLKTALSISKERRAAIVKVVRTLHGDRTIRFMDALLALEELEFSRQGKNLRAEAEYFQNLREITDPAWIQTQGQDFFTRLNGVRRFLIAHSLKNYCRDRATLTELSLEHCTNCVGQTSLLLGTYLDLKIQPPSGYVFGFVLFSDHISPVLYNKNKGIFIDLVTNKIAKIGPNPVLAPNELLRMGLRKHRELVLQWDKVDLENYEYIYDGGLLGRLRSAVPSLPDFSAVGSQQRIDAYQFSGIRTAARFATSPVPATADLSDALDNEYSGEADIDVGGELNLHVRKGGGEGQRGQSESLLRPSQYENGSFHPDAVATLIPQERAAYQDLIKRDRVSNSEYSQFGIERVVPEQSSTILLPFRIAVKPELKDQAPFWISKPSGESVLVEFPTEDLAQEFRSLPIVLRYKKLSQLAKKFFAVDVATDMNQMIQLLQSDDFIQKASLEPETFHNLFQRLYYAQFSFGSGNLRLSFRLDRESPGTALRLGQAITKFAAHLGQNHRTFLAEVSKLSDRRIQNLMTFLFRFRSRYAGFTYSVQAGGHYRNIVANMLRPLMLAILYDKKILWVAPRTEEEKRNAEALKEQMVVVEDKPEMVLRGPPVALPKMGKCGADDHGWMEDGLFVWKCPGKPQTRVTLKVGTRTATIDLRETREIPAMLLGGLFAFNDQMFMHPGHFVLLHEAWSNSVAQAITNYQTVWDRLDHLGLDTHQLRASLSLPWKFSSLLLSPNLPLLATIDGATPDFMKYVGVRRETPAWLDLHPNYLLAYLNFKNRPRPEVKKRAVIFTEDESLEKKPSFSTSAQTPSPSPTVRGTYQSQSGYEGSGFNSSPTPWSKATIFGQFENPAIYAQDGGIIEGRTESRIDLVAKIGNHFVSVSAETRGSAINARGYDGSTMTSYGMAYGMATVPTSVTYAIGDGQIFEDMYLSSSPIQKSQAGQKK